MKTDKLLNFFLFSICIVFFIYIFYLQCIKYSYYLNKARIQHEKKMVLVGSRGNIYDRNGLPLATSHPCFSIFCTPRYSESPQQLARQLALISGRSEREFRKLIDGKKFFWVDKKVSASKKDEYLSINDPSIGFAHDIDRHYNMPEIFSSFIGKCGIDNRGIEGLEIQLDNILSGKSGFMIFQKDPTGEMFPYYDYPEKNPIPGKDVYLTIDFQLQTVLYANLREAVIQENANTASGLIIDPVTGEILAMVNIDENGSERNRIICDEFEPGSTFKLVPLTFALLSGHRENELIDTEGGKLKVRGHIINDFRDYGLVTLKKAIAHSSNVAMVKISSSFDRDDFSLIVRDFGFGQLTGIELPGEIKGRLPSLDKMNDIDFASFVFGQGLTVNLLQLAFAYQTIANDGILTKPIIIKEIHDNGKISFRNKTLRIRRVIDSSMSQRLTDLLCAVVEEGSGTEAAIEGVRVAGKTGTAQKVVDGTYSSRAIITTFIGFFPAEEPEFLIAVLLDEPKKGNWASAIAAPIFRRVAQSIYQINGHQYAIK